MASVFVFVLTYFALGLDLAFCAVARGARFGDGSRVHSHDHSADRCEGRFCRDAAANCGVRRRGEPCCLQHCHFYRAGRERKPGSSFETIIKPILANLFVLALGGFFGFLLKLLFRKRSTDNRLIVSLATLFAFCGVCALLGVSPLLGCMSMGMVYINLTNDANLFQQLAYFSPPVLLLFFVRSGLSFRLDTLFGAQNTLGSVR